MLHAKPRFHAKGRALFDRKGLLVQRLETLRGREIDDDVGSVFDFQPEREDDDFARVVGGGDGSARTQAEGGFPFLEGFVFGVWREEGWLVGCVGFWCEGEERVG